MKLSIREEALFIIKTLEDGGFEAYLVGGAVRDIIIASNQDIDPSEAIKDYDFTTNATPD